MAKPFNPHSSIGRLQLAQRVHQLLVREIDHAIEVERLLTDARYARDVLLVCDALAGSEAPSLAAQFRLMPLPAAAAAGARGPGGAPGHAQQATDWARDTSGFGVTQPPPVVLGAGAGAGSRPATAEPLAGQPTSAPTSASTSRPNSAPEQRRSWLARWRDSR